MPTETITYAPLGSMTYKRGDDGFLYVTGRVSDDTLDLDNQICDPDWLKGEVPEWMKIGNVRVMHQAQTGGKATALEQNGTGWDATIKVTNPQAALDVEEGVLTGLSVGIKGARVVKDEAAPNGRIIGGKIIEVSLVDRPANPSCKIEVAKAAGDTLEVVVDGTVPCTTCNGVGKIFADGAAEQTCETCGGNGEGSLKDYPALDGGDKEDGEVKTLTTDYFGYSDEDKAAWSAWEKQLMPDSYKKDYSDKERAAMADKGEAMPGGGYPIKTVGDLKNAIQAIGRAKDPVATKTHIKARAKALGQEALIPDDWKASVSLSGLVSTLSKGATADQWMHDPTELAAIRDGLVACIKAELDEFASGDDERWDVEQLVTALNLVLSWWQDESFEGETSSPFGNGAEMSFVGLGIEPDLVKSASAEDATDEAKSAFKSELLKTLGLDELKSSIEVLREENSVLKADLAGVKEMAAPKGISLRATQFQQGRVSELEKLEAKAMEYKTIALETPDPQTRSQYMIEAAKAQDQADSIRKSLEGDK